MTQLSVRLKKVRDCCAKAMWCHRSTSVSRDLVQRFSFICDEVSTRRRCRVGSVPQSINASRAWTMIAVRIGVLASGYQIARTEWNYSASDKEGTAPLDGGL